jgi:hypothetical protein
MSIFSRNRNKIFFLSTAFLAIFLLLVSNFAASATLPVYTSPGQQFLNSIKSQTPSQLQRFPAGFAVSDFVRETLLSSEKEFFLASQGTPVDQQISPYLSTIIPPHRYTRDKTDLPQNEISVAVNTTTSTVVIGDNDYRNYSTFANGCFIFGRCNGTWIGTGIEVGNNGGSSPNVLDCLTGMPKCPMNKNILGGVQGDPAVAIARNGNIYVASLNFSAFSCESGVVLWVSTNGGSSFTPTKTDPVRALSQCNYFADKDYVAVGTDGTLYVTWTNFSSVAATPTVAVSTNGGASWTQHKLASDPSCAFFCQFAYPAVASGKTAYVAFANYTQAVLNLRACVGLPGTCNNGYGPITILVSKTTNDGASWSKPVLAATIKEPLTWPFGFPDLADQLFRVATQPKIAVAPNGNVYVAWEDLSLGVQQQLGKCFNQEFLTGSVSQFIPECPPGSRGSSVFVVTSTTGGSSWSSPVLASGPQTTARFDAFMPWVSVDPSNRNVQIAYYTTQLDKVFNHDIAIGLATSTTSGTSFTQAILPHTYDPSVESFFFGGFWGDYLGLQAVSGHCTIGYTGDATQIQGYYQQDPYITVVTC